MADRIPRNFLSSPDAVPSYDYQDIASGTGHEAFYGMLDEDGNYTLTPLNTIALSGLPSQGSNLPFTSKSAGTGAFEMNFDVEFIIPRRVKGVLYVNLSYSSKSSNGVANCNTNVDLRVLHVDSGGTETEIGSSKTTGTHRWPSGSSGEHAARSVISWDISDTLFKKSEKLRIEATLNVASGTNCNSKLLHDPANEDVGIDYDNPSGQTANSTFLVLVPFRIEI